MTMLLTLAMAAFWSRLREVAPSCITRHMGPDPLPDSAKRTASTTGTADTAADGDAVSGAERPGADDDGALSPPYEEWTKSELYDRAKELDIAGRSTMNKAELIEALREN